MRDFQNEADFKNKFIKIFKKLNIEQDNFYISRLESSFGNGLPDILISTKLSNFLIEVKNFSNYLSMKQNFIYEINANNFIIYYKKIKFGYAFFLENKTENIEEYCDSLENLVYIVNKYVFTKEV